MKRHLDHDHAGGPVSAATRDDLALAIQRLADAEVARCEAVAALARVRARGDGEAAAGMPVDQMLRWRTNLRHGAVSTISVITDVAVELPTVMAESAAGRANLDQLAAIAWPAARVSRDLRRSLDLALSELAWTTWSPDVIEVEVSRLLEDLAPAATEAQERQRAQRQFLHLQATLDGQGLTFTGQAWGVDAALVDATIRSAAPAPAADDPDPDGVLVGRPTTRSGGLFQGLLRVCRDWADGGADPATRAGTDPDGDPRQVQTPRPPLTLYAIVDETADGSGSGELLTATRGLAPRLSAAQVRALPDDDVRRIEVFSVDGEIVRVQGRAGHAITDPDGLSEETTRIICTIRDRTCRAPGCDRPASHLHHLVWRGLAKARGEVAPDDPRHRTFLCERCHHRVVHKWRWSGTVGALGRVTWHRPGSGLTAGGHGTGASTGASTGPGASTTVVTRGRLDQRLRPPPSPTAPPSGGAPVHLDQFGDPVPF